MNRNRLYILLIVSLLAFIPENNIQENEFPVFRVVIDPGHGGVLLKDKKKHGDKFDIISAEYLDYFAEGAIYKDIYEHEIVYSIALKAIQLLSYCSKDGDYQQFKKILKKYTSGPVKKIYIETLLSRGEPIDKHEIKKKDDPNAEFRLYDFPGPDGDMKMGRISKINEYKPHLVVSLHLAKSASSDYKGMNGIIVPPYNVLKKGLLRLQCDDILKDLNDNSILSSWFRQSNSISSRYAFYDDSARYFTTYGLTKDYKINHDDYNGYKYNMVTWRYRDKACWEVEAVKHLSNSKYSSDYKTFREEGSFWEREKSIYEEYRRGSSFENFGGDNYFATYEIIKFVLYSLNEAGVSHRDKIPGKPYISTWSVPMLINAISAYIELGYLDRKWDREVLLYRQDEIAEGVAVGIYSLFTGIDHIHGKFKHKPSGKSIDLKRYSITKDESYFDIVMD